MSTVADRYTLVANLALKPRLEYGEKLGAQKSFHVIMKPSSKKE